MTEQQDGRCEQWMLTHTPDYERDMATEGMDGINLSRNESLSNDTDPTYF